MAQSEAPAIVIDLQCLVNQSQEENLQWSAEKLPSFSFLISGNARD